MRPGWDDYFLDIARMTATRSTCPRAQVGALIVVKNQIVSHGYNGAPKGLAHCELVGCNIHEGHCIRTVHAEVNAILRASTLEDATLYSTHFPCYECCKILLNTPIERLVFDKTYYDDREWFAEGATQYDWLAGNIAIIGQLEFRE